MNDLIRGLYRLASLLNTIRAAQRGPGALERNLLHKAIYRSEGQATRRALRKWGL